MSSNCCSNHHEKVLTVETMNEDMRNCRYEVRGEIYLAATKRAQEGKEVIYLNVGNPQALGQKPLTFNRQVLALVTAPFLLESPDVHKLFPQDAIERAKVYLKHVKGGIGAYSDSIGNAFIRKEIASFIEAQSGFPANIDHIYITNGASECARLLLQALIRGKIDGVMVPVPQYPLYSAAITLYGGTLVPYYLNEANTWSLDIEELERSIIQAKRKGINCRALVFINPGNPTGQCLTYDNLAALLHFCSEHHLILIADEVYQENIYFPESKSFVPARQVLHESPAHIRDHVELCTFHTVSKGVYGECGLRGGYMELVNFDEQVHKELFKVSSINLSPNVPGQIALGLMVNPPQPGDLSYESYQDEKDAIFASLQRKAKVITETFNALPGVSCQPTEGAMYSFPQLSLPLKAIEVAKERNQAPDVFYCLQLLQETGISCVPGSGFQQAPGTFHLRTTILPSEEVLPGILEKFRLFHLNFMKRYGGDGVRAKL